ncbi:MAG: hypothetical protein D6693_04240, partial [Planctomycetota bacterium]
MTRIRRLRDGRGSILVMTVGVLAVLAVMALSYVTVVRIDRRSTDAYQRDENLQQQVVVATSWIRALLAADLFGNRMVNANTPRTLSGGDSNLPRAFEDGEYADTPWTDLDPRNPGNTLTGVPYTWNTAFATPGNPNPAPPLNAQLDPTGQNNSIPDRAAPGDAWLASTQPIDTGQSSNDGAEWDTWPQISNLLSAYRYRNTSQFIGWARDSGR